MAAPKLVELVPAATVTAARLPYLLHIDRVELEVGSAVLAEYGLLGTRCFRRRERAVLTWL